MSFDQTISWRTRHQAKDLLARYPEGGDLALKIARIAGMSNQQVQARMDSTLRVMARTLDEAGFANGMTVIARSQRRREAVEKALEIARSDIEWQRMVDRGERDDQEGLTTACNDLIEALHDQGVRAHKPDRPKLGRLRSRLPHLHDWVEESVTEKWSEQMRRMIDISTQQCPCGARRQTVRVQSIVGKRCVAIWDLPSADYAAHRRQLALSSGGARSR